MCCYVSPLCSQVDETYSIDFSDLRTPGDSGLSSPLLSDPDSAVAAEAFTLGVAAIEMSDPNGEPKASFDHFGYGIIAYKRELWLHEVLGRCSDPTVGLLLSACWVEGLSESCGEPL